jgi:glycosyltransferase involved in cell wall biosynthesis
VKDNLSIILVDDHGTPSAKSLLTPSVVKRCNFDLTVYEIEDDLHHNTPGALNLGMMAASTDWILIMDSDCSFDPETMERLMAYKPMDGWLYKFDRNRITDDPKLKANTRYLPCTMLMQRKIFLSVNGFDEDFTGARSGGYAFFDNHFDSKVYNAGWNMGRASLKSDLIATEWMEDVVGIKVPRTDKEQLINRKLMYAKMADTKLENHKILRFAWKRVYHSGQ